MIITIIMYILYTHVVIDISLHDRLFNCTKIKYKHKHKAVILSIMYRKLTKCNFYINYAFNMYIVIYVAVLHT